MLSIPHSKLTEAYWRGLVKESVNEDNVNQWDAHFGEEDPLLQWTTLGSLEQYIHRGFAERGSLIYNFFAALYIICS